MILAVDVGTSVLKAALFERDGIATSRSECPLALVPDPDPVRHEADAREWIRGMRQVNEGLGRPGGERAEAVRLVGMDPGKFPPSLASGAPVGKVTAAGAEATGVPEGAPVFAGAPDCIVSLLGAAAVVPGRACLRAGTSEGVDLCSQTEIRDLRRRTARSFSTTSRRSRPGRTGFSFYPILPARGRRSGIRTLGGRSSASR